MLFSWPLHLINYWKPRHDAPKDEEDSNYLSTSFSTKRSYKLEDRCALLIIVLIHQHIPSGATNPFCASINNIADDYGHNATERPSQTLHNYVSFSNLYDIISSRLADDRTILILYNLLYRNADFQTYVLSRTDVDTLIIPILRLLHVTRDTQPNRVYMLLVILLILSQDSTFNTTLFTTNVSSAPWITEQIVMDASIGSLMVIVLVRVVQENLRKKKDLYLHSNCLAILANMSSSFQGVHPYASQRLLFMFDFLRKRYIRIAARLSTLSPQYNQSQDAAFGFESNDRTADELRKSAATEEMAEELAIYSDLISIVLGTINGIIFAALPRNPCLIYALIHQKDLFSSFRTHPKFSEIVENIESVLAFFNRKLEQSRYLHKRTVEDILEIISNSSKTWTSDRLRVVPVLQYQYNEEESPHEFFVPYVWAIIRTYFDTPWGSERMVLNSLDNYESDSDGQSGHSEHETVTLDLQRRPAT
eukprot:TRINITY_DN2287_c0_g2_i2.p1 TRINITY_DN2287_c0_g2~~TRINITY_DN2287_c0_g2_i2.p1  ORF type:complete len:477 (-),score=68.70 TRINITY_DN2287_c0_g2_i2:211-1641(-)